jgi:hypothetical protein
LEAYTIRKFQHFIGNFNRTLQTRILIKMQNWKKVGDIKLEVKSLKFNLFFGRINSIDNFCTKLYESYLAHSKLTKFLSNF